MCGNQRWNQPAGKKATGNNLCVCVCVAATVATACVQTEGRWGGQRCSGVQRFNYSLMNRATTIRISVGNVVGGAAGPTNVPGRSLLREVEEKTESSENGRRGRSGFAHSSSSGRVGGGVGCAPVCVLPCKGSVCVGNATLAKRRYREADADAQR